MALVGKPPQEIFLRTPPRIMLAVPAKPHRIKGSHRRRRGVASRVWLPGQYFDAELGTHYNYYRDCYEPATGRYCQSDPINLYGGLATYAYVQSNPLGYVDPKGLEGYGSWSNPTYIPPPGGGSGGGLGCGDYCNCLANCIRLNDPLSDPDKFVLGAAGGTFPKSAVGLPQGLGGASPLTTTPSTLAHFGQKCFRIPRYIVQGARGFGRFFSPVFIGYGLGMATVEVGCAAACADNSSLY